LSRCISSRDLPVAAITVLQQCDIDQIRFENKEDAVDFNFALLWKWSKNNHDGITTKDVQQILGTVDNCYAEKDLEQVNQCNLS